MSDGNYWAPSHNIVLEQFIGTVRLYMRDYAVLNRLIAGEEHSDRMIAWAVIDTIDDFNSTPPITNYTLLNFPSSSLLVRGTTVNLLQSVGLLMTRNQLNFSDGGLQVSVSDKAPLIQSWIQMLSNGYEEKKKQLKIALNLEGGWGGGVHSEYKWINGFYGGY